MYSVQGMNDIFDTDHRLKLKDVFNSSNRLYYSGQIKEGE